MDLTIKDVRKVANLARINCSPKQEEQMLEQLQNIFTWIEQLNEVDTKDVDPLVAISQNKLFEREDKITDGQILDKVLSNAPKKEDDFFVIPKVIE